MCVCVRFFLRSCPLENFWPHLCLDENHDSVALDGHSPSLAWALCSGSHVAGCLARRGTFAMEILGHIRELDAAGVANPVPAPRQCGPCNDSSPTDGLCCNSDSEQIRQREGSFSYVGVQLIRRLTFSIVSGCGAIFGMSKKGVYFVKKRICVFIRNVPNRLVSGEMYISIITHEQPRTRRCTIHRPKTLWISHAIVCILFRVSVDAAFAFATSLLHCVEVF